MLNLNNNLECVKNGPKALPYQLTLGYDLNKTNYPYLRIITYNVLAKQYAAMEDAKEKMYYYCDSDYLDIGYRKQLILNELIKYNGDIICLQEVDKSIFEEYYLSHMTLQGIFIFIIIKVIYVIIKRISLLLFK